MSILYMRSARWVDEPNVRAVKARECARLAPEAEKSYFAAALATTEVCRVVVIGRNAQSCASFAAREQFVEEFLRMAFDVPAQRRRATPLLARKEPPRQS